MIRTQVSFDERFYRDVRREARRQGVSFAELCRRALARVLADRLASAPAGGEASRPWMELAGSVCSGDPGASRSVNQVVYGRERP